MTRIPGTPPRAGRRTPRQLAEPVPGQSALFGEPVPATEPTPFDPFYVDQAGNLRACCELCPDESPPLQRKSTGQLWLTGHHGRQHR